MSPTDKFLQSLGFTEARWYQTSAACVSRCYWVNFVSNLFSFHQHFGEMPFQSTFSSEAVGDLPPLGPGDNSIMIVSHVYAPAGLPLSQ